MANYRCTKPTFREQKAITEIYTTLNDMVRNLEASIRENTFYVRLIVGTKERRYHLGLTRLPQEERRIIRSSSIDHPVFRAGDPTYFQDLLKIALEKRPDNIQPVLRLGEMLFSRLEGERLFYSTQR